MYSIHLTLWSKLSLALLLGFATMAFFAFSQQAQAANTISTAVYQDSDGNGTVDRIRWTMDENVTACAYEAGDWTVNTAGTITVAITSLTCTGANAVLDINITADSNETGGGTNPVISYANVGVAGSVTLTSGAMTAKSSQANTDGAAPVVVSTTPSSSAGSIASSTSIVITFSEAMVTAFVESTEFTLTPDPGTFDAAVFSSGDTVVTLDFPNLTCGQAYTLSTIEAAIDAAAGSPTVLVTTGPQDGDWTFTTTSCSAVDITPPVVTAFTYTGPSCSAQDAHAFTITGENIDAYLVSDNQYFPTSLWISQNIEGSSNIYPTFDEGTDTAYFMLKSDTGNLSATYGFTLDSWTDICTEADTPAEEETEETPADDGSGSVTPVAGVSPGDLIHSSTSTAVYYVTEDYTRRVFINEQTYFTWYANFANVVEISLDTMAELPLGNSMLPQAGVVLVKIQSSPVVYLLEEGEDLTPTLREIPDEATASSLYGSAWADYVIDIEPTFFTRFGMGTAISVDEGLIIDMDVMKTRVDLVAM